MLPALTQQQDAIHNLCQAHQVLRLWVFGSAARTAVETDINDIDFLVQFAPLEPVAHKNAYFGLWFDLEDTLGRSVDLIEVGTITNPYVNNSIQHDRQVIYAAA